MSVRKLPISVIIPVLNCAHRLRQHLEAALEWLPHVEEIIVVDSHSEDRSVEIIESLIGHLPLVILQHPNGLYTCWNYGVSYAKGDYVYFSTVGDTITLAGLRSLYESAEKFCADLVISPPLLVGESEDSLVESTWPIHDIIKQLNIEKPRVISPRVLYDFVLIFLERAVLGSSASNLYRRDVLMRHPFSDNFHSSGDSGWIIENNFSLKTVISPEEVSTFLYHAKDWNFGRNDDGRGQRLRRDLAYRAFKISIIHTDGIDDSQSASMLNMIEGALGDETTVGALSDDVIDELENSFRNLEDARGLLFRLRAMTLKLEYLRHRERERKYKKRLGAFRCLWPPSRINRKLQKKSKMKLDQLIFEVSERVNV